jgi:hypothetical protein
MILIMVLHVVGSSIAQMIIGKIKKIVSHGKFVVVLDIILEELCVRLVHHLASVYMSNEEIRVGYLPPLSHRYLSQQGNSAEMVRWQAC